MPSLSSSRSSSSSIPSISESVPTNAEASKVSVKFRSALVIEATGTFKSSSVLSKLSNWNSSSIPSKSAAGSTIRSEELFVNWLNNESSEKSESPSALFVLLVEVSVELWDSDSSSSSPARVSSSEPTSGLGKDSAEEPSVVSIMSSTTAGAAPSNIILGSSDNKILGL